NHDGGKKMRREPVLTHFDAMGEAAFDHEPAERALQSAEDEKQRQFRPQRPSDPAADQEPQERQQEHDPDQPAPEPMKIFPEIDALELCQGHAGMDGVKLREDRKSV